MVSNIEVSAGLGGGFAVRSNLTLHRVRYNDDVEVHASARADHLGYVEDQLRLLKREVHLAHGILGAADFEFFL